MFSPLALRTEVERFFMGHLSHFCSLQLFEIFDLFIYMLQGMEVIITAIEEYASELEKSFHFFLKK